MHAIRSSYLSVLTPTGFFPFIVPLSSGLPHLLKVLSIYCRLFPLLILPPFLSSSSSALRSLRLWLLLPNCPTEVNAPDHGDHLLGLLESTILIPENWNENFQESNFIGTWKSQIVTLLVLEMAKPEFLEHFILGWKGVFRGLTELACRDIARQKPLAFWAWALAFLLSFLFPPVFLTCHPHSNKGDLSFLVRASLAFNWTHKYSCSISCLVSLLRAHWLPIVRWIVDFSL